MALEPHPLLDLCADEIRHARVAVHDGKRQSFAAALAPHGAARAALESSTPLLLVGLAEKDLSTISSLVHITPAQVPSALLIRSGRDTAGAMIHDVASLVDPDGPALAAFAEQVRAGGVPRARSFDEFPDGLKKLVFPAFSQSSNFTFSGELNFRQRSNTTGVLTISWDVLAFRFQNHETRQPIVSVSASYALNPGRLFEDIAGFRGFGAVSLSSSLKINGDFSTFAKHVPDAGTNDWDSSQEVNISYILPDNSVGVYTYVIRADQTISEWSVRPRHDETNQGSQWYMNSPCDGLNPAGTWRQMLEAGGVAQFPAASVSSTIFKEASVWKRGAMTPAEVTLSGSFITQGLAVQGNSFVGFNAISSATAVAFMQLNLGGLA